MARLKPSKVRFPSPEVQGEGSYVDFNRAKWGAVRDLPAVRTGGQAAAVNGAEAIEAAENFVCGCLAGWNWVDDDGTLMVLPRDRAALAELTSDEVTFLMTCAMSLVTPAEKTQAKT